LVAAEEVGAGAASAVGAIDAEKDGRAGDAAAVEQVADRGERGGAVDALLASDVDGELGRLVELIGQLERREVTREQARAFEGDQAASFDLQDRLEQRFDAVAAVDRDRDDREVFGEREQAVGVECPVARRRAIRRGCGRVRRNRW